LNRCRFLIHKKAARLNFQIIAQAGEQPATTWRSQRYVPLACWALTILVLVLIPLKIVSYGFVPGGDARRHVAKAFTDKPYNEIVVMRPGYKIDHSPGWEWLLRLLHQKAGLGQDALVGFSVIVLLLCFFFAPLPWLRCPEAWLAVLLMEFLARPTLLGNRLTQGRPFLLTEGFLIVVLLAWSKPNSDKPSWLKIALTCMGFGLSVWIHGAWYLWVVPLAAFFLAGAWRAGLWLTCCWLIGTLAGAAVTGRPFDLLTTAVAMALAIYHEHLPQWMLVGEFAPDKGDIGTLTLLAFVFLLCRWQNKLKPGFFRQPVVWLMMIGWILGFAADRFWADWGLPAAMIWMVMQLQEFVMVFPGATSLKRLAAFALIAAPLFLNTTADYDRRYTFNLSQPFLNAQDPKLRGWFPEHNGIFYTVQMDFFYDTFYTNPNGDWRYIVGFEPAWMPEEDRKIFRRIVWNQEAFKAYEPWIDKMRPEDRLAIFSSAQPNLPRLEWVEAADYIWVGRLPASESP
jgi:hypothetical protein